MKRRVGNPLWGSAQLRFGPIAWEPAQWELLLRSLHIRTDDEAVRVMMTKTEKSRRLREWIAKSAYSKYVPTAALRVAQLKGAVDSRFLSGSSWD